MDEDEQKRLRRERALEWRKRKEAAKQQEAALAPAPAAPPTAGPAPTSAFRPLATAARPPPAATSRTLTSMKLPTLSLGTLAKKSTTHIMPSIADNDDDSATGTDQGKLATKRPKLRFVAFDDAAPIDTRSQKEFLADGGALNPAKAPSSSTTSSNPPAASNDDLLEAYMLNVQSEVAQLKQSDLARDGRPQPKNGNSARLAERDDEDGDNFPAAAGEDELLALLAKVKKKEMQAVDHEKMEYQPFRKNFYIEAPEIARMSAKEVEVLRTELDQIKIRGKACPKPVKKWTQCGLPLQCENIIRQLDFKAPTAIQAQAIPAIMSGRDVIGVAKTGSGKTMAFLLPMFRHIKDQPPVENQQGPIAVIMTPTRELAMQIYNEARRFAKFLNLRVMCAYGGAPIKDQIGEMKRGNEIVVCTPGRLIDLLCANNGRVTNLQRVTYLVLDEADRMFDMGFEQQVMKIIQNVRPDAQRVLFSATFPRQMEALARRILKKPVEITVGGRSVVCGDVTQFVEVLDEDGKFLRLLELLGNWYNEEKDQRMLIFVDRQEAADELLGKLYKRGYRCLSLHGGKDQMDRDSTILDFKTGVCDILIATSVAARGLDVKECNVVINYECPNHMEDYVHRVGRTGRAGRKGSAYTFITIEQERFAPDIYQALIKSGVEAPADLKRMKDDFLEKVGKGEANMAGSGFGGKGLERLEDERAMVKKAQKRSYAADNNNDDDDMSDEENLAEQVEAKLAAMTEKADSTHGDGSVGGQSATAQPALSATASAAVKIAQQAAERINATVGKVTTQVGPTEALNLVNEQLMKSSAAYAAAAATLPGGKEFKPTFAVEIEINDYPEKARRRATSKETVEDIAERTHTSITTRGSFFPPGKLPKPGERKLFLIIEGDSEMGVDYAKREMTRALLEAQISSNEMDRRAASQNTAGRYSVL